MYPLKRNPAETQLGEAAFDATRVARLLRAADGSVRVALIGPAGEFASVPLVDRTREGLVRAVQVVAELRSRLSRPAAPVPPPPQQVVAPVAISRVVASAAPVNGWDAAAPGDRVRWKPSARIAAKGAKPVEGTLLAAIRAGSTTRFAKIDAGGKTVQVWENQGALAVLGSEARGPVAEVAPRMPRATVPAPVPPPPRVSPRPAPPAPAKTPPQPAPSAPAALTFADKVETLRRHIEEAQGAKIRAAAREKGIEAPTSAFDYMALRVEPSRQYWYLIAQGSRRWAIDTADGSVYPMNSAGVMGRKHGMPGIPIDDMGLYEWASRYYWPPKAAAPSPVAWVRSDLPPPAAPKPKKPAEEREVRFAFAPNPDVVAWKPTRVIKAVGTEIPGITGSMTPGWEGAGYASTRGMYGAQVAAVIRADIKQAIADGALPPLDFTVNTRTYAGGYSIDVEVTRLRAGLRLLNPEWVEAKFKTGDGRGMGYVEEYTPEGKALLANLNAIYGAYNYDNSDIMSDYHHRRYYGHVQLSSTLFRQEEFDALDRLGLAPRRDAYLEASIGAVTRETPALRILQRHHVRALPTGSGDQYRLQWVDENTKPPRVLAEVETSQGDLLEMLYAWASEFATKKNGRARAARGGRR